KNNIKFGNPNATDEEMIDIAKKAQCHDFIMKLPQAYETVLQEGGSNLSGGERQRISIARAMLKPSRFVVLDEATSSVDPENEKELLIALKNLLKGKTVIVIAHKLSTVKNADQ
ncbi:ATP-binding cassette domain-containing protein, partial [Peptostreptococcus anaerobius]